MLNENVDFTNKTLEHLSQNGDMTLNSIEARQVIVENDEKMLSNEQILKIFQNLRFPLAIKELLAKSYEYVLAVLIKTDESAGSLLLNSEVHEYMRDEYDFSWGQEEFNTLWGMIKVFYSLGVDKNNIELCEALLIEVQNQLGQKKNETILNYHNKYKQNHE